MLLMAVFGAGPEAASEELVSSEVESATIACPSERTRCRLSLSEAEPPAVVGGAFRN